MNLYLNRNVFYRVTIITILSFLISGCIEPTDIATENFEDILVVDALLTDELKNHEIRLARTFSFEQDTMPAETGATIFIRDSRGNDFRFQEEEDGKYISQQKFQAIRGTEYQMFIETRAGQSFSSDNILFQQQSTLDSLYVKRITNDDGLEGVGIFVDSFDPTGNSMYYRYEFQETYRYVAERWINFDIEATTLDNGGISVTIEERPIDKRTCYIQNLSNSIILNNTISLDEDRVDNFEIKFIDAQNISVADRYSILVRQYVQSREANAFYETLANFSESDNLFSQIQPGFIGGNINQVDSDEGRVLGYFDVSAVSEKRIFFDRDDMLKNLPEFTVRCMPTFLARDALFESLEDYLARVQRFVNTGVFVLEERPRIPVQEGGSVSLIPRACGDCTFFGESEVPDFWID